MNKMRLTILGLAGWLALALAVGCGEQSSEPEAAVPPTLIGTWEWVVTTGPNIYYTPQNQGYDLTLIFNEDSTYGEYKDGGLIFHGAFSVGDSVYWMDEWMRLLTLEDYLVMKAFTFHTNDTLVLADSIQSNALVVKYKKVPQ
jgi:hypothetical protein